MRGLHGDFSTMPLKDVVVYLGNHRASGTLCLEHEGQQKQVVLRDGRVVSAHSNEPREYLGQLLINLGHITEEQFNKAFETQKETRIFLGKILVMTGAVSEEAVHNALNLKIRETLLQAFHWVEGSFAFDPEDRPEVQEGMELSVDLLDVHREGEFRETAWEAIRAAFPSGEVRLQLHEQRLPGPPPEGSLDQRLFALIRAGQTIDEIILALHATDFFLYQRLYALYRLEAVEVAEQSPGAPPPPQKPATVGDETGAAEILAAAEMFLAQHRYLDAEPLARRAHELMPSEITQALLRRARAGLLEALRQRLYEGRPVASLRVPPSQLKTLQLSAPERYLLSRVDGVRDVPSIVQASPLQELEALRLFQHFIEVRLVSVERR